MAKRRIDVNCQIIMLPCIQFLTITNLIALVSLKWHENSATNMINSFCSNSEQKIYPLFTHNGIEVPGDATDGIRARVTALGPNWVQHVVRKHEE